MRNSNPVYAPLERFLNSLRMPLLTRLTNSAVYVTAAESGLGIFEMDEGVTANERQEFIEWVSRGYTGPVFRNVVALSTARIANDTAQG